MDYYKVLGVGENADEQEIRKAYRKLSLRHHPDRGGDAEEFKKINEAYSTLGDKVKRQQYNIQKSNPFMSGMGMPGMGGMGGDPNIDPILKMFFGGGMPGMPSRSGPTLLLLRAATRGRRLGAALTVCTAVLRTASRRA